MTEVRLIRPVEVLRTVNNPILNKELDTIKEGFDLPDVRNYLDLVRPQGAIDSSRMNLIREITASKAAELLEYHSSDTKNSKNADCCSGPLYESLLGIFDSAQAIAEKSQVDGVQKIHARNQDKSLAPEFQAKKIFTGPTARIEDHPVETSGMTSIISSLCKATIPQSWNKALNFIEQGLPLFCKKFVKMLLEKLVDLGLPSLFKDTIYKEREHLRNLIEHGPENGQVTFDNPKDKYELAASIIRWLTITEERKLRIRCDQDIRVQLGNLLDSDSSYTRSEAMVGGITAFSSLMLSVQGHDVTMYNEGHIIKGLSKHFPSDIKVLNEDSSITKLSELELKNSKPSPGHFTMSLVDFSLPKVLGNLTIRYKKSSAEIASLKIPKGHLYGKDRDVIISGATFPIGFSEAINDERLKTVAQTHHASLLSGFQYPLTMDEYLSYDRGVKLLGSGTAPVVIEYSEPKCKGTDVELFGICLLREDPISMIAFNTSEAEGLLSRLKEWKDKPVTDFARTIEKKLNLDTDFWLDLNNILARSRAQEVEKDKFHPEAPWRNPQEDSIWLYDAARLIQQLTQIPVVRIRAMDADVTLFDLPLSQIDATTVVQGVTFSRQQAYLKSAVESGNIKNYREEVLVTALPTPEIIASNKRLAIELTDRFPTEITLQKKIGDDWFTTLPNGQLVVLAVPFNFRVQFHTVSAGDTMAATATAELSEILKTIHRRITNKTAEIGFSHPYNYYG